jgi:hypothetical protein
MTLNSYYKSLYIPTCLGGSVLVRTQLAAYNQTHINT